MSKNEHHKIIKYKGTETWQITVWLLCSILFCHYNIYSYSSPIWILEMKIFCKIIFRNPNRARESMPYCAAFWVFLGLIHDNCWQLLCVYIRSWWCRRYFWLHVTAELRLKIYSEQTKTVKVHVRREWHMIEETAAPGDVYFKKVGHR